MSTKIDQFLKTELKYLDVPANLYYIKFDSDNLPDMCLCELDGEYFVLGLRSGPYDTYTFLAKKYLDVELDLFMIRSCVSLGWHQNIGINKKILKLITDQL